MSENVEPRRRAYVNQEISRAVVGFPKSDEITRKVVPVAIRAVQMFDTLEYGENEMAKFFEDGASDKTMNALYFSCLSEAVIQGKKWCNDHHEFPKSCDCVELFKVILGIVPASLPLEQIDGE